MSVALRVSRVSKRFDNARSGPVLCSVSLEIVSGQYVAIMGESGVGKSTLLNVIAGLETPDSGAVLLDGVDLTELEDDQLTHLRRTRMGFVFQAFHVLPYLSVAQNVELPLALLRTDASRASRRVQEMLEAVGLAARRDSPPRELSGGELQRVAIARALVHQPRLVLADEPTGNLDPVTARQTLDLLRSQIKQNGACGILVTHSLEAAQSADEVFTLTPEGLVPASV